MNRVETTAIVEAALDLLVKDQPELLALDVTERAVSHHLARYIAALIPNDQGLKVDVEYNRHGADPKRLNLPPRNALDRELRATTVFPDIIVHKRGTDRHNVLVLELKKPGESTDYDALKLQAFRDVLGYSHAAHVILGLSRDGNLVREVIWVNG